MNKVNSHGVGLCEVTSFEMNTILEKFVPFEEITREVIQKARIEQIAAANLANKSELIGTAALDKKFPIDALIGRVLLSELAERSILACGIENADREAILKTTYIFSRQGPALGQAAWTVYSTIRSNLVKQLRELAAHCAELDKKCTDNQEKLNATCKKQRKSEN